MREDRLRSLEFIDEERTVAVFRSVAKDLVRNLKDPETKDRINRLYLQWLPEIIVIRKKDLEDPTRLWEKTAVAIAALDLGARENDFTIAEQILKNLFTPRQAEIKPPLNMARAAIKDLLLKGDLLVSGVQPEDVTRLMDKTGQNKELMLLGMSNVEVRNTLRAMFESGDWLDERGGLLIKLPLTTAEAREIMVGRYQKIEMVQEVYFGGVMMPFTDRQGKPRKAVLVFSDTDRSVLEHELAHRDNPGVTLGPMGNGINEPLTDLKASERFGRGEYHARYQSEAKALLALGPKLVRRLLERYQDDDLEKAKELAYELINNLGLEKYLALYRMQPHRGEFTDELRRRGYLPTKEVIGLLEQ